MEMIDEKAKADNPAYRVGVPTRKRLAEHYPNHILAPGKSGIL